MFFKLAHAMVIHNMRVAQVQVQELLTNPLFPPTTKGAQQEFTTRRGDSIPQARVVEILSFLGYAGHTVC